MTLFLFLIIIFSNPSYAIEYFISSPEPEPYKHLDADFYALGLKTDPYTFVNFPSIQLYYGMMRDLDIELLLNYAFYKPQGIGSVSADGIGDTLVTSTYCMLHESKYLPQVSFIPSVVITTGNYNEGLGNGKTEFFLPLSVMKTWHSWRFISNLGYTYNKAPFTRNYFYGGLRLGYGITERLTLGAELYGQGATASNIKSDAVTDPNYILAVGQYFLLNLGVDYQLTKKLTLQAGMGKNVSGDNIMTAFIGMNYAIF